MRYRAVSLLLVLAAAIFYAAGFSGTEAVRTGVGATPCLAGTVC